MMHTAACHIRMPAYRHKTNTPAPISSAAEMLTVKARHLLSSLDSRRLARPCYRAPKLRPVLRRSHRTRNRHLSHTPATSPAIAPHSHTGRPLRHPVNLRPTLITSCQRPLAFRKARDAKNAAPPDTIGSGKHRVSSRAAPPHTSDHGAARLYSVLMHWPYRGPRPAP
jgi:hypothetical protein